MFFNIQQNANQMENKENGMRKKSTFNSEFSFKLWDCLKLTENYSRRNLAIASLFAASVPLVGYSKSNNSGTKLKNEGSSVQQNKATPISKPGQGNSIEGNSNVGAGLGQAQSENFTKNSQTNRKIKTRNDLEGASKILEDIKRKAPTLSLGNFRSQHLSDGQVNAPGIADFAAYFRSMDSKNNPDARGKLGTSTNDQMSREAQAEALRAQTSESIRKILQTTTSADQRVNLQMRLAEIQIERHGYFLEFEIQKFNVSHDAWMKNKKGGEPVFDTSKSRAQLMLGIETLRTLVTQMPNHARAPEAMFNLGFFLVQMNSDSAALYFKKLVESYPKSDFVSDSYLALGEFYFNKQSWSKAQENYKKVLSHKSSRAYPYAVYKLGWTYFNIPSRGTNPNENLTKSLSAFKLIVKLADDPKADKNTKGLKEEALKDMVLVFAELGDVAAAQRYYESIGETKYYFTFVERLAFQFAEKGKYKESSDLYLRLVREAPLSPRLPVYLTKSAETFEKMAQRGELVKTLQQAALVLADDSQWMKTNQGIESAKKDRDNLLENETRLWAQKFHKEAQKLKKEAAYDQALLCYSIYLTKYGQTAESYVAHFYRAEIYTHKEKLIAAADGYMATAAIDQKYKINGKFTRDAVENSIIALDNALETAPPLKLPEPGKASQAIPFTELHAKLLKALDTYLLLYPNDPKTLNFSHRGAGLNYAFGDYENADKRWTAVVTKYPKSKEAHDGALLIVKVPVDKKDWPNAIKSSRKFLAIAGVKETKLADSLVKVLKGSLFQQGIFLEKADKREEAANIFIDYQKEFPADTDSPKALFNAANNKFRIGKMDEAISHLTILITKYPKNELAPNVLYLIANSYDAIGQYEDSAKYFEQFAREYAKLEGAEESLYRATIERNAIGDSEKAIENANIFIAQRKNSKDLPAIYIAAAKSYLRLNKSSAAYKILAQGAQSLPRDRAAHSVLLYGMAADYAFKAQDIKAMNHYIASGNSVIKTLGTKASDPTALEGIRFIGETQVAHLDTQLLEIYKRKISNATKLTIEFGKMRDDIQALAQKYLAIVQLGNAESGIGALYRVAEMQDFMAETLLKAPVPDNAKPEEIEQYRATLEGIALPVQEKATALYLTAWQKANDTEAVTHFTAKLRDKLAVLRAGEYPKISSDFPTPSYFNGDIALTNETKALFKD